MLIYICILTFFSVVRRRRTYVGLEVDKFKNRQLQTVEEFKCKTLIDITTTKKVYV